LGTPPDGSGKYEAPAPPSLEPATAAGAAVPANATTDAITAAKVIVFLCTKKPTETTPP
jgi:hypothetical protein